MLRVTWLHCELWGVLLAKAQCSAAESKIVQCVCLQQCMSVGMSAGAPFQEAVLWP